MAGDLSLTEAAASGDRASLRSPLAGTAHLLGVLGPADTFPKAVLAYAALHRLDRRSDWPSQACLLPEKMSVPLVWTVLWIQVDPGEDTVP